MKMILVLSWRNVWRNKFRSLVIITALTLGLFASVFSIAFMNGLVDQRIKSVINTEIAHIQIHKKQFRDNTDFSLRIQNTDSIVNIIKANKEIIGISERTIMNSMIASAETGVGVKIIGINPTNEKLVCNVNTKIIEGDFFVTKKKNPIVIGKKLAEKLKVNIGKKLIITAQDNNKNIVNAAFKIVGIFETDNSNFDENTVYVKKNDISAITGIENSESHEIAILVDKNADAKVVAQSLSDNIKNLEILDWLSLSPEAGYLVDSMQQYMYIFIVIILLALGFGIINTMLMAVMERYKELGMLMSIGLSKAKIFYMIMIETVLLSLVGGISGIFTGFVCIGYLGHYGINLHMWKEAFSEMGYASYIYPFVNYDSYINIFGYLSCI